MQTYHLDLAAFEFIMFLILVLVQKLVARTRNATPMNLADQGPWWSVLYHRVWLACHVLPLIVSVALTSAAKAIGLKKEVALPLILFPVVNYAALLFTLKG
jgi:hypothetical protein